VVSVYQKILKQPYQFIRANCGRSWRISMGTMYFDAEPIPEVEAFIKKHYKGGTVLDFGCGCGRYAHCFPDDMYTGVDGYMENIKFCKQTFGGKFLLKDLETWKPTKRYDYLFSSVTMEQLENLPMDWADNYILVEPMGLKHNYQEIYKPEVDEGLSAAKEVRLMLCKTHSK
jgi:SAM-dependent methyltransferase